MFCKDKRIGKERIGVNQYHCKVRVKCKCIVLQLCRPGGRPRPHWTEITMWAGRRSFLESPWRIHLLTSSSFQRCSGSPPPSPNPVSLPCHVSCPQPSKAVWLRPVCGAPWAATLLPNPRSPTLACLSSPLGQGRSRVPRF